MPDLTPLLVDLGAASVAAVWMPVLAWTALALVAEGALRGTRASARMGLGVRGALMALLPALLVVPSVLARWVPSLWPASPDAGTPTGLAEAAVRSGGVPEAAVPMGDLAFGVVLLVAVGAAVLAVGVLLGGLWWLRRYRRTLGAVSASVAFQARAVAEELGVRGPLTIALAEPASSPFTMGWRRPVVAVPPDLDGEPLRLALAHELAHVREAHFGWSLAERAVRAVFVWHPLVHVLGRGLALDRERAADAAVLRLWPERARSYGLLLYTLASRPSPALALGASSSPLLHRLDAMTRLRPDRRSLALMASALVLVIPLVFAATVFPDEAVSSPEVRAASSELVVASDTLDPYVATVQVRSDDESRRVEVTLMPGTSRAAAVAIADDFSAGGEPGDLRVIYDGGTITRSTVRMDAIPPPPPPAPAPPPSPAPAPPPPPPAPPSAPAPPPPPAPAPPPPAPEPPPPPAPESSVAPAPPAPPSAPLPPSAPAPRVGSGQ